MEAAAAAAPPSYFVKLFFHSLRFYVQALLRFGFFSPTSSKILDTKIFKMLEA